MDRVCRNLLAAEYRYAKTMPENPHWYTLRKTWDDDAAFQECVQYIRDNGYIEIYKKSRYTMFNLNGYKYWTMGAPINKRDGSPCTILSNRAKTAEPSDYDLIAERYDGLFEDLDSYNENQEIFRAIGAQTRKRTLDIGCGTGLFLEQFPLGMRSYIGIDPSAQMLGQLVNNFPAYSGCICHGKFEEFYDAGDGFDLIVSLFGSMNYVRPDTLHRIFDMLRPGGRAFLMFYQEDYLPVTYERSGMAFPYFNTSDYNLARFEKTLHRDTYVICQYERPA